MMCRYYRQLLTALMAMAFIPGAFAQAWPAKPIKLVVPYAAGGPTDVMSRAVGGHLTELLGQQILVDNRAGAAGGIGTAYVAKSAPDGYTLLFGATPTLAINPHLYSNIPYDALKDFAPISTIADYIFVLVANPALQAKSMADLIVLAKVKPGTISYGSSGYGSANHMESEILALMTGTRMVHVPYKGDAPALADVIGGQISFLMTSPPSALQNHRAGRVRALATTGRMRHADMPDLPTIAETVPGFEFQGWWGYLAPAGAPPEIINRLAAELRKIMALPVMKAQLVGLDPVTSTPDELAQRMRREFAHWADIVKKTGVHLD